MITQPGLLLYQKTGRQVNILVILDDWTTANFEHFRCGFFTDTAVEATTDKSRTVNGFSKYYRLIKMDTFNEINVYI